MGLPQSFEFGAVSAALLALWMVGITDFRASVTLFGIQSFVLGLVAIAIGARHGEPLLILVGVAVIVLKGLIVPYYLIYAGRRIGCRRDSLMPVSAPTQFFIALSLLSLVLLLRPLHAELPTSTLPAVGILILGMMLMITRRLAVSQIVGFLVLENGIFLYTIGQSHSMPIVVEIGVLMDVLSCVMLAGLLAFKINKTFEHIDVAELTELIG